MPMQTWGVQFHPSAAQTTPLAYIVNSHSPHFAHPRTVATAIDVLACGEEPLVGPCQIDFQVPEEWGCGMVTVAASRPGQCWRFTQDGEKVAIEEGEMPIYVAVECDPSVRGEFSGAFFYGECPEPPLPIDAPEPGFGLMLAVAVLAITSARRRSANGRGATARG